LVGKNFDPQFKIIVLPSSKQQLQQSSYNTTPRAASNGDICKYLQSCTREMGITDGYVRFFSTNSYWNLFNWHHCVLGTRFVISYFGSDTQATISLSI